MVIAEGRDVSLPRIPDPGAVTKGNPHRIPWRMDDKRPQGAKPRTFRLEAGGRSGLVRLGVRFVSYVAVAALVTASAARGADHLALAPGLSFSNDSSDSFPIRGDHLGDAESQPGRPTVMFFGAAHCWNTNREAERLVALYPKYQDRVSFIIVDVNHPSPSQRRLLDSYYQGSIPALVVRAPDGALVYSQAGETAGTRGDTRALDSIIGKALGR